MQIDMFTVAGISRYSNDRPFTHEIVTLANDNERIQALCYNKHLYETLIAAKTRHNNEPFTVKATLIDECGDIVLAGVEECPLNVRDELMSFLDSNLPDNWNGVASVLLESPINDSEVVDDRFFVEYASASDHDCRPGGLAAHTLKMLNICKAVIENDERLSPYAGLLYVGILLHDMGKVEEYRDGKKSPTSIQTHRVIGLEYLARVKAYIVSTVGLENYETLQSIVLTHHHEFGTPCDTLWAFLVHVIDMLDTFATIGINAIEAGKEDYITTGSYKLHL